MRVLPSGTTALLLEFDDLDQVLAMHAALTEDRPAGVLDIVPAARTVLLVIDPAVTSLAALETAVRRMKPRSGGRWAGELVEVPVTYDGQDLAAVAELLDCDGEELVRRHTGQEWTVAFCGFAPGFGYLSSPDWPFDVPRRPTPRTSVPPGSVALAG
ncbi:MAG: allophanate hydrolase subunit 1, partial [Actinomycetota bacterium]|nr:allophanate hydrolase subunit 1 [Actinomycetota bacterium]